MMPICRNVKFGLAWIALVAICIFVICSTIQRREMHKETLSPRLSDYAIPASISALRGLRDYTAYMDVAAHFIHHKEQPISVNIWSAMYTQIQNPVYRLLFSGDDKGLVDLVYFSFAFFGPYILSIYISIAILSAMSISIFIFEFYRSSQRMALLIAMLTSFYVLLFTFGITDQSSSILEPRFIGFLGAVPLLHIVLVALDGQRPSGWSIARTTAQIILLMFVVHIRTSEAWQVICIVMACLIGLSFRKNWRVALGIVAVVGSLAIAGSLYRGKTYHREYRTTDITTRVLWHNAIMGLAINPAIRERYSLRALDDSAVTEGVKTFLQSTGQTESLAHIFSKPDYASGNFSGFRWSAYEEKAREFYFRIFREMPLEVIYTYVVVMPKVFAANISYMSGYSFLAGYGLHVGTPKASEQRDQASNYLNPLRHFAIGMLALVTLLLAMRDESMDLVALVAVATVFICSMIPPALATPVFQYIQLTVLLLVGGCYFLFALVLAKGLRRLVSRLRRPLDHASQAESLKSPT